jgi:hypothetical protein
MFKWLTARRLYKSFGVKGLIAIHSYFSVIYPIKLPVKHFILASPFVS